ncbi:MAG: hypothetical protein KDM64_03615, partial [Verrucomicrobiae bacterium]|nr:hypothetical protein [Verrucomicrobiae bacterium]
YITNLTSLSGGAGSAITGTAGDGTAKNYGIYAKEDTLLGGSLTLGSFTGTAGSGAGSTDLGGKLFVP